MAWIGFMAALVMIVGILMDAFEAMILPRRVRHSYRLSDSFHRFSWHACRIVARKVPAGRRRNALLSVFGPAALFAVVSIWASGLIVGFALIHWSFALPTVGSDGSFMGHVYFSGITFFTLGYGDMVPTSTIGRILSVIEAGIGFSFLAIIIGYLPVLYQAFSRREIVISLLDARAGSPPSAGELLRRMADGRGSAGLNDLLVDWERWSAELLEGNISFPVLSHYRSQHDNQSWVGALTTMLDTSAVLVASGDPAIGYQARLTFAMARHAAVDLGLVFRTLPRSPQSDRLPAADLAKIIESFPGLGFTVPDQSAMASALAKLRGLYEPFVNALGQHFMLVLPAFRTAVEPVDNWQTSAGMSRALGLDELPEARGNDEHFD